MPLHLSLLEKHAGDRQLLEEQVDAYQQVVWRVWEVVKGQFGQFSVDVLQEFFEFAFSDAVMERNRDLQLVDYAKDFYIHLSEDIKKESQSYWLLLRTHFNHLMYIFASKPYLLKGFEHFLLEFLISREIRAVDAEINLHHFQHLVPQVFPKAPKSLEQVSFQGAYVRTMAMLTLESLIHDGKRMLSLP